MYTWTITRRTGLLLFLCLYFIVPSNAQNNWQLKKTVDGVQCYSAIVSCNGNPAVLLRFVNTNSSEVKVSWKDAFQIQESEEKTEAFYGSRELNLPPGETSASGCTEVKNKKCLILPGDAIPTHKVTIKDFEFREISVSRL
ncbi:MAG: hypothetical protein ACXWV5_08230 [Flavitalea sp.]